MGVCFSQRIIFFVYNSSIPFLNFIYFSLFSLLEKKCLLLFLESVILIFLSFHYFRHFSTTPSSPICFVHFTVLPPICLFTVETRSKPNENIVGCIPRRLTSILDRSFLFLFFFFQNSRFPLI